MSKAKIQITLEEELLQEVDDYCDKNYMNRSWLITQSLVQVLNQQKLIDALANISLSIKTAVETGVLTEEDKKELDQFQALCKLFAK